MKQDLRVMLHLLEFCLPIFCFQSKEMTMGDWLLEQMQRTTPVMAYIDEVHEDESSSDTQNGADLQMEDKVAYENMMEQKRMEQEKEEQDASQMAALENNASTDLADASLPAFVDGESKWSKQVEINKDKLLDFDYLMKNYYRVDRTTTMDSSEMNPQALLEKDLSVNLNVQGPVVLIYHTHSQEGFVDSDGTDQTSVMALGDRLTQLLSEVYGIPTLHHLGKYDVDGRDYAYSNALPDVTKVLEEHPSIQVVIDLHRDGVAEGTHLVTEINGKPTAKIMFFNGLSKTTSTGQIDYLQNPNLQDNLAMSLQMQIAAAELYPGFTRPVFFKGYRYNMHVCPKTMLIEVGAQTNTYSEVYNAMEPLANILSYVLLGNPVP